MDDRPRCAICDHVLGDHHLMFSGGVAYAAVFDAEGRARPCGALEGDALYLSGRAHELECAARSLTNLAGRWRTRGYPSAAAGLRATAERKAAEARRLWAAARHTRNLWRKA